MSCVSTFRGTLLLGFCLLGAGLGCGQESTSPGIVNKPVVPQAQVGATSSEPSVTFLTDTGPQQVFLEVVTTPAKIQRGLMYRKHMAPDRGMLFVFPGEQVRSFWMKNTLIPLDMIFVRSDLTVVGVTENTVPLTLDSCSVGIPSQYVIEVNGGWTADHGVKAGTSVVFSNLPKP